jgi:hypothetical protein
MTSAILTPTCRTLRSRIAARWRAMLLRASIKRFEEHAALLAHELDKLPRSLYLTELHLADMRVRLALTELDL